MNSDERIELHIHSKFGGDSTVYPGEIIKKLNDRGIPAVAITDTSSIYAFPEIEKVYDLISDNYSKGSTRCIN